MRDYNIKEMINIKLETTRAICSKIIDSNLTDLSDAAKLEFADIIELIAILMLEHAGEFPEEWTSEKLVDIYHHKLPTLLDQRERKNIKDILMTYVDFVGNALELPNYLEIKKVLHPRSQRPGIENRKSEKIKEKNLVLELSHGG